MSKNADPSTQGTIIVGIIGAILVLVAIVALQALFYNVETAEEYNKVYKLRPQELTRLHADQLERLNSYRWVEEANGRVAIPIDRAMEAVVADLAAGRDPVTTQPVQTP
jgi:hypothetical protein